MHTLQPATNETYCKIYRRRRGRPRIVENRQAPKKSLLRQELVYLKSANRLYATLSESNIKLNKYLTRDNARLKAENIRLKETIAKLEERIEVLNNQAEIRVSLSIILNLK